MKSLVNLLKPAYIGLVSTLFLITACTPMQQRPTPDQISWQTHQQQLSQLTQWSIIGKLGIRLPEQSNSARFNWQQQNQQFDIRLTNLLGQSVASLVGDNKQVQLDISGQGRYITDSPSLLLQRELGWTFPVEMLNYWIKGLPAPDHLASYQLNDQGLLAILDQADWQVTFSRYQAFESHTLPGKIRLQQGNVGLTLVIKRWKLPLEQANATQ